MKLVYLKESKSAGYMILGVDLGDGAKPYTVPLSLYSEIGAPVRGAELSEGDFSALAYADEVFRVTKKARSLLAYADNNLKNLKIKLLRAGFSRDAIEAVSEDMQRNGYINEARQLERLILTEANLNLKGRGVIVPKMVSKGYKRDEVESVLDSLLESGEIDFSKIKELLISKKLGECRDFEAVKKLLYKNGFHHSD